MKTRKWIGSVVIVLAATALVFAQKQGGDTRALQGKKAPAFEMPTLEGETVNLESLKGNVVVLDFWATWCGPCVKAMPHLQEMANNTELQEKGLKVFAVNLRESEDKVKAFIEKNSYTMTVPMDKDGAVADTYKVQGIPTQVVIGRDGMIKKVFVGDGGEKLNEAVTMALRAKAPAAGGSTPNPSKEN
jgi:peroxiredoxin